MHARKITAFLLTTLLGAALLGGCGSSGSGGSDVPAGGTPSAATVQTLGIDNCAVCHGSTPVAANWLASPHANGNLTRAHEGNPTCAPCHNQLGDGDGMSQAFVGVVNRDVVSCESCHGGGSAHRGVGLLPHAVPGPAQCGQCHGVQAATDGRHADKIGRIINDTHYDNPETAGIEGYVVDVEDGRGCQKCHFNAHSLNLDINKAWAASGHAGQVSEVKANAEAAAIAAGLPQAEQAAAVVAAVVTDETGPAWAHYDFKGADRTACQRCHTSSGAANFLSDPAGYDPTQNVFAATGQQREMLYCWGCHADNTGALRNPGALAITYRPGVSQAFPDVNASNVCLACHTGRESGNSIATATADFTSASFLNSHYLAAGGTLYGTIGYHYAGRVYDSVNLHTTIGTSASIGAAVGSNGPCVMCHMSPDADGNPGHTFEVVTHTDGQITGVNPTFCNSCHIGSLAFVAADLNGIKDEAEAALGALQAQLAAKGIFFANAYPYFFKSADDLTSANAFKNWEGVYSGKGKDVMGAAFNFNLLAHEPGSYAHNKRYAQRLTWDSIDLLDDGLLNNSTVAAINALPLDGVTRSIVLGYLGNTRP